MKRMVIMDKRPEATQVVEEFVEDLKAGGFEVFMRESFLRWRDMDVHLVQKEGVSGVLFIKMIKPKNEEDKKEERWGINSELLDSFKQLASDDEDTGLYVIFLENAKQGYFIEADAFSVVRKKLKENDEDGEVDVPADLVRKDFASNHFDNVEDVIKKLEN
ncbi:MAG: hypothetical protein KAT46_02320 [Deltaproteobacteria bacterium]|nr:hypothetical protein [Deltaproteobacteria bacterium]